MGWIDKRPVDHHCATPETGEWPYDYGTGSVWECDDCKKQWVFGYGVWIDIPIPAEKNPTKPTRSWKQWW